MCGKDFAALAAAAAAYLYEEACDPITLAALLVSIGDQIALIAAAEQACK